MAVIDSQLDTQSDAFKNNAEVMTAAVDEFRGIERRVIEAAEVKIPRYRKKGFIPPRERLSLLLGRRSELNEDEEAELKTLLRSPEKTVDKKAP